MRALDWAATPLGPASGWPQSLKATIRILLSSRFAMWMCWGPELTFFCNDAYKPTLGVKGDWALGARADRVWEEIWEDIGPRIDTVLRTGQATWDENLLLYLERSGFPEETYHTFSYSPLADDRGAIVGMLCVVAETTERVIAERRMALLRDLATQLTGVFTLDGICDALHRVSRNHDDLPLLAAYLHDEDGGGATRICYVGDDQDRARLPISIAAGDGSAWVTAMQDCRSGPLLIEKLASLTGDLAGTGCWETPPEQGLLVTLQGSDRIAGFLVVGLNPHRRHDEDYAGFVALLAGQIEASLKSVHAYEEERRRAEALAELDRAKTAFFSNVSHEFRTPLTLMLGPLEDALNRPDLLGSEELRNTLDLAHRNGLRLLRMVNTLLDFSRIEAGRNDARFEPTDLGAFTADLAANFRSAMERAGLRFTVDCQPLPHPVHVDREMWEKVVLNLISNAFKFTFEGEVSVTIAADADGRHAELRVRDTGIGIAAEELPHLFERFYRVVDARGRSFEGTGIGLALARELVTLHGGSIRAESEPDRGSCFIVSIPFGTQHLPPEHVVKTPSSPQSASPQAIGYVAEALRWLPDEDRPAADDAGNLGLPAQPGPRILLADDNADMRDYVRRLLESHGYRVETAADGRAALESVLNNPPDLVLSDVMMPRLDGFGLLAAIRAQPGMEMMPVILLSARAGEEARLEALQAGAYDYLVKPFSARDLLARVGSKLQIAGMHRETQRALVEEASTLEIINRLAATVAAEIDLDRTVQVVTDAATELTGAAFGAFFYNVVNSEGERYMLYTISGAPREAFSKFPMPRNTAIFGPTFRGEDVVLSDDITQDPRYGQNAPYRGMPEGHLPVRSYLSAPVIAASGEVLGAIFLGHPEAGIFTDRAKRLVKAIAPHAAIAIEKARLYQAAQTEIAERRQVEEERERLVAALRELNQTLETKVVERTADLVRANQKLRSEAQERERVEEALRQAQKMEAIGQLTGGVAHDFNNLLTVIIGNLETLQRQFDRETPDRQRMRRSVENATRGAQRAAALTQRLLAFSRRQPLEPKPVDVNKLVSGMSDLLRRTLGEQVSVEVVLAGGLWRTHADPNQLESAILNLAVNARDAMPDGGKLIIETANTEIHEEQAVRQSEMAPGQYVMICVSDSGRGMTPEVMAHAFEPFFTTKDVGHGTGLGLSQVYGFVKQSGGHVKLSSEPGQGTTVRVYLPRMIADTETEDQPAAFAGPFSDGEELVLVVEDDADVRAYSTEMLSDLGYKVLQAPDGRTALDLLDRHPDIVLLFTDVGLPGGMNGRQLADEALQRRPELKVLFTTGYARDAIVHDGRLDPGVQLITKPFTYAALAAKLRDILDVKSRRRSLLFVEDDAMMRGLMADALQDSGFRVLQAATGREAITRLRLGAGSIDAAVVDLGLPDMRGDELVGELRAIDTRLPIVIASGYGEATMRTRFADDPLLRFLEKPYVSTQLEDLLRDLGVAP